MKRRSNKLSLFYYHLKVFFRKYLWKTLGVDYNHVLKTIDYVFIRNDKFTEIGTNTYDNGAKVWRWTDAPLKIGKYCSIANNVNFIVDQGGHTFSEITNFPLITNLFRDDESLEGYNKIFHPDQIYPQKGIEIGNDVWIGMGAIILPGIKIGNGATIAAGSVITKNIPSYATVGGTPAKIIKMKHSDDIIYKLNRIAWWNWTKELIKKRIEDFTLTPEDFISKYYREK
jgi:virginiamycin A acetyltransferase